jgi:hypothetical protein
MQEKPIGDDTDGSNRRAQRFVLGVVVNKKQRPWSVEEIVRTLEDTCRKLDIEDAVAQLRVLGLINQADRLVFASQAAAHIDRLGMLSI